MKKILKAFVFFCIITSVLIAQVPHPSLDGRAIVAPKGSYPSGLYGKAPGFLPGDTVIVTSYTTGFSIEVLILSSIDASSGLAIELSEESAKALEISRDTDSYVKVQKKAANQKEIIKTPAEKIEDNKSLDVDKNPSIALKENEIKEYINGIKDKHNSEESRLLIVDNSKVIDNNFSNENNQVEDFIIDTSKLEQSNLEEEPSLELLGNLDENSFEEIEEFSDEDETIEIAYLDELDDEEDDEEIEEFFEEDETTEIAYLDELDDEDKDEEIGEFFEEDETTEIALFEFEDPIEEIEEDEDIFNDEDYAEYAILEETEPQYPEENLEAKSIFDEIISSISIDEEEISNYEEDSETFVSLIDERIEDSTEFENYEESETIVSIDVEKTEEKTLVTKSLELLEKNKYYIQIATVKQEESLETILNNYASKYPVEVLNASGLYQVILGPFSDDEYKVVLERFKQREFKDAFVRFIK